MAFWDKVKPEGLWSDQAFQIGCFTAPWPNTSRWKQASRGYSWVGSIHSFNHCPALPCLAFVLIGFLIWVLAAMLFSALRHNQFTPLSISSCLYIRHLNQALTNSNLQHAGDVTLCFHQRLQMSISRPYPNDHPPTNHPHIKHSSALLLTPLRGRTL